MDFSPITVSVRGDFCTEWGSGRKQVSREMYSVAKRSVEDLAALPGSRLDEPPFDSYRTPLAREFRYAFNRLMTKKRKRQSTDEEEVSRVTTRFVILY